MFLDLSQSPLERPLLSTGEVHLWIADPDDAKDSQLVTAYCELLDAQERDLYQHFHFERHRHQYLVAHTLVRVTLSRYALVAPHAWSYQKNEFGRPEIRGAGASALRFSLSHTDGMVLCAVTRGEDVGVDVEAVRPLEEIIDLADRVLAPREVTALRALPPHRQLARFFECWTLKEAYAKARGRGLSLRFDRIDFHLSPGLPPRVSFDSDLQDTPDAWQFLQLRPSDRHIAALAARRTRALPLAWRCWRTVPLDRDEPVPCSAIAHRTPTRSPKWP